MKKLLLLGLLIVCVSSLAFSQVSLGTVHEWPIVLGAAGDTVVNSLSDTTGWYRVGGAPMVALKYTFADRYSVQNIRIDYRAQGSTVVVQCADTLAAFSSSTDGTTTYREVLLRDSKVNYIPVLQGTFRIITNFLASGNDTGKLFYLKLLYGGN